MIDLETERAVERWVRLGDEVSGRSAADERTTCTRCGSHDRVLGRGSDVLCARCYLEHREGAGS